MASLRVLAPAESGAGARVTPLAAAIALGEQDGIDTLVVELGANNVLGVVVRLEVKWTDDDGFDDPKRLCKYTVWRPIHFEQELSLLVKEVRKVKARQHHLIALATLLASSLLGTGSLGAQNQQPLCRNADAAAQGSFH